MRSPSTLLLLGFNSLLAFSIPLRNAHFRRLTRLPISRVGSMSENVVERDAVDAAAGSQVSDQQQTTPTPFLWMPSVPPPSSIAPLSVSISTTIEVVWETITSTIHEEPETVTITAAPTTVTNTITVSDPFTATPGSFWSAPALFSNLDSFKIAHFACGERNLEITSGVPPDAFDDFLVVNGLGYDDNTKSLQDQIGMWNSSSALQLLYPEGSINPGNSPQGGADFYSTPLPLADASNVTLEYSVFFPKDFDWVLGGKLPGLYGGHMTCSGGDDATECFSTRLMWRAGGAGELYLYAPKDKQSYALCHAPPESVCNAAYGLSVGRGSFKFTPGAWTHVRQTVALNTPGKHNGGFRLEVDGKVVMNRHDVFYRDIPSKVTLSSSATQTTEPGEDDADDGGLLPSLIGGILGGHGKAGSNQSISAPFITSNSSSPFSTSLHYSYTNPPLLPFRQQQLPMTLTFTSASHSRITTTALHQPTVTQTVPSSTVTVTNYLWEHTFDVSGKEAEISAVDDGDGDPKSIGFSGLFFSTFFGGSSEEYATPRDQYTWFKDFAITINS